MIAGWDEFQTPASMGSDSFRVLVAAHSPPIESLIGPRIPALTRSTPPAGPDTSSAACDFRESGKRVSAQVEWWQKLAAWHAETPHVLSWPPPLAPAERLFINAAYGVGSLY